MCLTESSNYGVNVSLQLWSNTAFFPWSSRLIGLDNTILQISKCFYSLLKSIVCKSLLPFTLISELKKIIRAVFFFLWHISYFTVGKNLSVFISFSLPETFQKFVIYILCWRKVSTCNSLWEWRKSLRRSFKEYRIWFLTLCIFWFRSWM